MKLIFLGDSITEGVGASSPDKKYVALIEQAIGCTAVNYGVSGTKIARVPVERNASIEDWDFQQRAYIMDKDADMVFVFGGTNDFGHAKTMLGEKHSYDPYTFWGGMNNLTEYLLSNYRKERICFILPLRRWNEENALGQHLIQYIEIMKTVLTEKGIAFIDFYQNGLPKPKNEEPNEYFCDGLHPNDNGNRWIAEQILSFLNRKEKVN